MAVAENAAPVMGEPRRYWPKPGTSRLPAGIRNCPPARAPAPESPLSRASCAVAGPGRPIQAPSEASASAAAILVTMGSPDVAPKQTMLDNLSGCRALGYSVGASGFE